jgi:predicted transcriptional regulator
MDYMVKRTKYYYFLFLSGASNQDLEKVGATVHDIETLHQFHELIESRDMLASEIAKKLDIPKSTVKKMIHLRDRSANKV